ncbi:MAG: hypothetical protein U9N85_11215 [Bacteroidota bacterium]|nr:hypothetical protein [Bacteroidota bacterium]
MKSKRNILLALILFSLFSCNENPFEADISTIDLNVEVNHFDAEIKNFNINNADTFINKKTTKYKDFFEIYNSQILRLSLHDSTHYKENFLNFIKYNKAEGIFAAVDSIFGDYKILDGQIIQLLKYYKLHFPEKELPNIVTFLSGFNHSVITTESYLGIALDKYLGKDCNFYQGADKYLRYRMDKAYIPVDVAGAIAESEFLFNLKGSNMLENMIYRGKVQYFTNSLLPNYPDTTRFIYTEKQLEWVQQNEANIYNHLTEDKLLFSNDLLKIRQYTQNAPFTIPLSDASAPRAAAFVGYKIVFAYMQNNPNLSLSDLMNENDTQKILDGANYNPK